MDNYRSSKIIVINHLLRDIRPERENSRAAIIAQVTERDHPAQLMAPSLRRER
jgi:hypothetical protein